ncbi:hypothetical protein D910_08473 [Dendroctonus ponderosae]
MYNNQCDSFHAKYKVLKKIGEGAFSEVLKCLNKDTGELYAAKRLKRFYKSESSVVKCAEVVAVRKVPFHSNILNIFEYHYYSFSGQVTFMLELMDMSLHDYLENCKKSENQSRGLTEQRAKEYLYQVLRGLEHLHRNGMFHRDVKPENILIKFPSIDGTSLQRLRRCEIIKLADLGAMRGFYSVPPYTEYISTRWYRSPECLLSNGHYGPKMDVWAAGCVFFEMLTLMPLFPGSSEVDQLYKIHNVLGSPSIQFINKLNSWSRNCVIFPKIRGTGLEPLLPQATPQTRGVLELMIEYDPDKRINVRRLLKNPYFDSVRYKFEPTMEGQPRFASYKIPKYGKRRHGDVTAVKPKISKRELVPDEAKRRYHSKGATPSIEIPYYSAATSSGKGKQVTLPLVDHKISRCVDINRVDSSDSNKSGLSRKGGIRKSVELILKSSKNSASSKHSISKEKADPRRFYSKSLPIPRRARSLEARPILSSPEVQNYCKEQ